jgi:uncharacterized membrane protein
MHPALRLVMCIAGIVLAVKLVDGNTVFLTALVGALAGLAVSEVTALRGLLGSLREELTALRRADSKRSAAPAPTAPSPQAADAFEYRRTIAEPERAAPRAESPAPPAATEWEPVAARPASPTPAMAARQTEAVVPSRPPPIRNAARKATDEHPLIAALREYFTGGNTLVRAGVVVLLFGVGFLLRYLAEHTHVPIEFRLSAVALGALALLVVGWRLRLRRPGYALALQGGAVGILYLTVFSALHLYALLTPTAAFALLAAISVLSATLAVLQNSLAVALLSITGGFLAPFLASTGHGNHVVLFSYFALLNAAILGIAWFRSWRVLNVAGFAFTFVLSAAWGVLQYRMQDFASTEPFLVLFFVFYVAIAVLYSTRQAPNLQGYLDSTIVFGTPIVAFGLQAGMLHDQRPALAYSALAVSALYTTLAWVLHRRRGEGQRLLVEAFMALGVAFLTLAVPLALNGRWSAASWALEGTALIWVGCRQNRRLPRAFGALLQLAAGGALGLTMSGSMAPAGTYIAALMVGATSVYGALVLHAHHARLREYEWTYAPLLFLWGLLWWCVGGLRELDQYVDKTYELASVLIFATATAILAGEIAARSRLMVARVPALALLPAMLLAALWAAGAQPHPLAHGGWLGWPLAFAGFGVVLKRLEESLVKDLTRGLHALALWLFTAIASWELAWVIGEAASHTGGWWMAAWSAVPAVILLALPLAVRRVRWPFGAHREVYLGLATLGIAAYLGIWSVVANARIANPSAPLPYIPLLNPLDLAQALALFAVIRSWLRLRAAAATESAIVDPRIAVGGLAFIAFYWLNAVLLRTLHAWAQIPYEFDALMRSTLVQSALSIFWALLALTTMLVATRLRERIVWLTGAALMAVVVAKLFLVDLSSIGTIDRIVSFVGVGVLMLVLGYFSPLPPATEEAR